MASHKLSELQTAYVSTTPCLAQQQQCCNQCMLYRCMLSVNARSALPSKLHLLCVSDGISQV